MTHNHSVSTCARPANFVLTTSGSAIAITTVLLQLAGRIDGLAVRAPVPAGCMIAAAERPQHIGAIVSRGARPDLVMEALPRLCAPTLLVVGGHDTSVREVNQKALYKLNFKTELTVVPGAIRLFAEPGALEQVAGLAREWFRAHLFDCTYEEDKYGRQTDKR